MATGMREGSQREAGGAAAVACATASRARRMSWGLGVLLVAIMVLPWGHGTAQAFIPSSDTPTLVQQLAELVRIKKELSEISGAMEDAADATAEMAELARRAHSAAEALHDYSPEAFWRDLKEDFYNIYPGFELLEGGKVAAWKQSRSGSAARAYEVIGAVFGELTRELREREATGRIETTEARIARYEAAGALAVAASAEEKTRSFDDDAKILWDQARRARSADEATVVSAKAMALVAVQQSHLIRLLSRSVRMDGIEAALRYRAQVAGMEGVAQLEKASQVLMRDAALAPRLMKFGPR